MSFDALLGRLKKKAISSTPQRSEMGASVCDDNSAYVAAMHEACASHVGRKRDRSPLSGAQQPHPAEGGSLDGQTTVPPPRETPVVEGVTLKYLTEEQFIEQHAVAEKALERCIEQLACSPTVPVALGTMEPSGKDITDDEVVLMGSRVTSLPLPLCRFLVERLQRLSIFAAVADTVYQDEECGLLSELAKVESRKLEALKAIPESLEELVEVLRTFWFSLCLYWRAALRGSASKGSPPECGWSYSAYLLQQHALPDIVRHTRGRQVALGLDAWQKSSAVRRAALDFLALVFHDVLVVTRQLLLGEAPKGSDEDPYVVPPIMAKNFFAMQKHLRGRDFSACRQLYVDLTLGTANWKLGLFSGGEVHMRRSMERIERRRIEHLLHNEKALRLLHALCELMDFVQQQEETLPQFFFLADTLEKDSGTQKP